MYLTLCRLYRVINPLSLQLYAFYPHNICTFKSTVTQNIKFRHVIWIKLHIIWSTVCHCNCKFWTLWDILVMSSHLFRYFLLTLFFLFAPLGPCSFVILTVWHYCLNFSCFLFMHGPCGFPFPFYLPAFIHFICPCSKPELESFSELPNSSYSVQMSSQR